MKKITFCVFLLFLSLKGQAQLTNGTFTEEVDYRLQNIDKAPITSNILIDRVFPVAAIQTFNQETRRDTSSYAHFTQAWSELNRASYVQNFATLAQLKNQLKNKAYPNNTVPIGIVNTEFHQGNFGTTLQNANVSFNESTGLFANIAGRNPFVKKQTTIIAPLVHSARGSRISFKTDPLFKLYQQGKKIKTLQLIANGSTFTLIANYNLVHLNFNTNYTTSGVKNLCFKITYQDNTRKTTYAKVQIYIPTNTLARGTTSALTPIFADNDLAFKGYEENTAIKGKNEYRIYYSGEDTVVDKPLYIIDGYDPGDTRKIERTDNGHDEKQESIRELMSYDHDNDVDTRDISLIDTLNHKGYDVIIVNHVVNEENGIDGGGDYIERNAYTFISLMRYIKSIQQGTEKAVVIGPSMGGLISRYALAYMEQKLDETGDHQKWDHNTRLWVSFDSPHQGANIPIGVQKGIEYLSSNLGVEGAKSFINKKLKKPATKQLLVNHYTNDTSLPVGAPNFRNRFQTALDALGMPQNLRKVALLNGSIMGALNGISSAKTLEIDTDINSIIILPYLPVTSIILTSLSNIFADKILCDFYHTTNKKIGNGKKFTFDGGIRGKFLWWKWWTTRTTFKSQPKAKGGYDIAPGSFFNAQRLVANQSVTQEGHIYVLLNIGISSGATVFDETHSFIPTKSALAYTGSNVLDEVIGRKDRVCSGETPFESYFAPQENEEHIFLTEENVAWLTNEIEGNPQPVSIHNEITHSSLSGDIAVCDNKTNTYTLDIPDSCSGYTVTWSTSDNIEIYASTNNSVNVRLLRDATSPIGFVSAYIKEIDQWLTNIVWVGIPSPDFLRIQKLGSYGFYSNQWTKLKVVHPIPASEFMAEDPGYGLSYQWLVPNSQVRTFTDTSTIDVNPNSSGQLNVGVKMQNPCGCTEYQYQLFDVQRPEGAGSNGGGILTPVGQN